LKPRRPSVGRSGLAVASGELAPFDPLDRVWYETRRENRVGMALGLAGALFLHGASAAHGFTALLDLEAFSIVVKDAVREDVSATYAVEVNKPPPEAKPEPEPPTPPEPEPQKPQYAAKTESQASSPEPQQAAAPAEAGKVLTSAPDPSEPVDLTDQGFISGEGDRFAGGVTAAAGTSKVAVRDTNAKVGGVPGGTGTGTKPPAPPPAPKENLSRPALPVSTNWDDCGFPPEADVEQIDFMRVSVVVTVGTDGRAQNVTVLKDPGYGFGRFARQCAMRKTYNVGLDVNGKPAATTTPPIVVRFTR
jgi:protein TonB